MKVKIQMEIEIEAEATDEEVEEFCEFEFGYNGVMSSKNPLSDKRYDVTDFYCEVL